jgi:hypothetical protein
MPAPLALADIDAIELQRCADGSHPLLGSGQSVEVDVADRQFGARTGQFDRQRSNPGAGSGHCGNVAGKPFQSHLPCVPCSELIVGHKTEVIAIVPVVRW